MFCLFTVTVCQQKKDPKKDVYVGVQSNRYSFCEVLSATESKKETNCTLGLYDCMYIMSTKVQKRPI